MKTKIQLRTNYANWFAAQAQVLENKASRAETQAFKAKEAGKRAELLQAAKEMMRSATELRNEESRYRINAKVCGEQFTCILR